MVGSAEANLASGPFAPTRERQPVTARLEMHDGLVEDRDTPRHGSDGQGRAWLESGPEQIEASGRGRWSFVFEVGPDGIELGGLVAFQVSPFWGWSPPQPFYPDVPGYTTVTTEAEGVLLDVGLPRMGDAWAPVFAEVGGRALVAGERLVVEYGAGPALARADRFAEEKSCFWFSVDGDADGVRELVDDPPYVSVRAGAPEWMVGTLPTTAAPGAEVSLRIAVLDALGNAGTSVEGEVLLDVSSPALELPDNVVLAAADGGLLSVTGRAVANGTVRVRLTGPDGLLAVSNPLEISGLDRPILWGDLHGHSFLSDGTGTPEAFFRYARDVAGLDVVALTDHDHWGFQFLDARPAVWRGLVDTANSFDNPGAFVALPAYEWTSWVHGHRHVVAFEDELPLFSSLDEQYSTPGGLWDALRGRPVLTFAHHSAGGPIATDWSWPPDPVLEPVTEIMSVHGSSEAADSPRRIYSPRAGHFVRDVLSAGHRLGFVGSGDSHDGHPGLTWLGSPQGHGGLVAFVDAERRRDSILEALRARRVYATSGPRILLRATLGGRPMGSLVPAGSASLTVVISAEAPLERVELIRSGALVQRVVDFGGLPDAALSFELDALAPGEWCYVRVVQAGDGLAWSSPFFVEEQSRSGDLDDL